MGLHKHLLVPRWVFGPSIRDPLEYKKGGNNPSQNIQENIWKLKKSADVAVAETTYALRDELEMEKDIPQEQYTLYFWNLDLPYKMASKIAQIKSDTVTLEN